MASLLVQDGPFTMARCPSPKLIRFLVTHWPLSPKPLVDVVRLMDELPSESWLSMDRAEMHRDLAATMDKFGPTVPIREIAKPTVVCIFGQGQAGKSTLASLLSQEQVPVFHTDGFFASLLDNWHGSAELLSLARRYTTKHIDQFIGHIQQHAEIAHTYVQLFFARGQGFNHREPLSLIEGMLFHPNCPCAVRIDREIRSRLIERGYQVWTTRRNSLP